MKYSFDFRKLALNVAKHGVWFSAAEDFEWETAWVQVVNRAGESRLLALGMLAGRMHLLVVTLRDSSVRIISLRKANQKEIRNYVDHQNPRRTDPSSAK